MAVGITGTSVGGTSVGCAGAGVLLTGTSVKVALGVSVGVLRQVPVTPRVTVEKTIVL